MSSTLKEKISSFQEQKLTSTIIIPLIESIHQGTIEYTHSNNESGRDIVSFGKDLIGRSHILCVQVKAIKISYGAAKFKSITDSAITAKDQGVITQSGNKVFPNEVWLISSKTFVDSERRQVSDSIENLEKKNIKIIALDELCNLLKEKAPHIIKTLSIVSNNSIEKLMTHKESRVFKFDYDKNIEQFYIPINLTTDTQFANLALANFIEVEDYQKELSAPIYEYISEDEIIKSHNYEIFAKVADKIEKNVSTIELSKKNIIKISCEIKYLSNIAEVVNSYKKYVEHKRKKKNNQGKKHKSLFSDEYTNENDDDSLFISFLVDYQLEEDYENLLKNTKSILNKCPKKLENNIIKFNDAYKAVYLLNDYIKYHLDENNAKILTKNFSLDKEIIRVNIPKPEKILKLSKIILIKGSPGSGKTTFLKILTNNLIHQSYNCDLIFCGSVPKKHQKTDMKSIISEFNQINNTKNNKTRKRVLIVDGLDEASFDFAQKILSVQENYDNIIVSTRPTYKTDFENYALNISLALFSTTERDLFFKKWFANNQYNYETIKILLKHEDINYHTRLPLIATITAALIEKGYKPTTRSEIYDNRLDLLLSEWDDFKNLKRYKVNNPKAKRRFLRDLAFSVHNSPERNRLFSKSIMNESYFNSLGHWGSKQNFQDIVQDLVNVSGVIIMEFANKYSFGHLSFQEYLVGEYIYENNFSVEEIFELMQNDWWYEPLMFYSSLKGDITELVDYIQEKSLWYENIELLHKMINYAPYTNSGAHEAIFEDYQNVNKLLNEE